MELHAIELKFQCRMEQVAELESRANLTIDNGKQQVQEAAEREQKQACIAEVNKMFIWNLLPYINPNESTNSEYNRLNRDSIFNRLQLLD